MVSVSFDKRVLVVFVFVAVVFGLAFVFALVDTTRPWHPDSQVDIGGASLEEAFGNGDIDPGIGTVTTNSLCTGQAGQAGADSINCQTICSFDQILKANANGQWVCAVDNGGPGGGGTVTSVGSGNGLTGGPITTSGALSVNIAQACQGTANKLTWSGSGFTCEADQTGGGGQPNCGNLGQCTDVYAREDGAESGFYAREGSDPRARLLKNSAGYGLMILRDTSSVDRVQLSAQSDSYLIGGRVGIGTNNPTYDLHVVGNIKADGLRVDGDMVVDDIESLGAIMTGSIGSCGVGDICSLNYLKIGKTGTSGPPPGDCNAASEAGRLYVETDAGILWICMGATRGWDVIQATN